MHNVISAVKLLCAVKVALVFRGGAHQVAMMTTGNFLFSVLHYLSVLCFSPSSFLCSVQRKGAWVPFAPPLSQSSKSRNPSLLPHSYFEMIHFNTLPPHYVLADKINIQGCAVSVLGVFVLQLFKTHCGAHVKDNPGALPHTSNQSCL